MIEINEYETEAIIGMFHDRIDALGGFPNLPMVEQRLLKKLIAGPEGRWKQTNTTKAHGIIKWDNIKESMRALVNERGSWAVKLQGFTNGGDPYVQVFCLNKK